MNRKRMEALRKIRKEIKAIEKQLDLRKGAETYQADVVKGSMVEFPYVETHIAVEGVADSLAERLKIKKEALNEELKVLESYFDRIEDSEIRTMMRYRYALGLTYQEIGIECGYDASVVYRKIMKYWNEVEAL